ncbi:MAG: Zeta toxin family protein, partial [Alphaproteobacteria bacterium]
MNDPKLIIVAGVNGCGKSTLTRSKRFRNTPVIDPDAIEKEALNNLQAGGRFIGGREAKRLRSSYFMDNKSFVIETTLAGQTIFKTIDEALSRGYFVELHYIYLLDIAVSVDRVKTRVMAGG